MKNWIVKNKLGLIGALAGAVAGYVYYAQVGCVTGTCAITSSPINSTIYFAFMGALAFSAFKKETKVKESETVNKSMGE
jgi:CDP-diglyceride synthetase